MEAAPSLSPRLTRALFWVGLAVLVAGTSFFVIKVFGGDDDTSTQAVRTPVNVERPPAQDGTAAQPKNTLNQTDIGKEARLVAGQFILTAVARKKLGESWKYIHPDLKAGYTLRQWKTGENPIVPFPVAALDQARFRITWRQANAMQLQVALIPKKKGDVPASIFDLGLRKVGTGERARWLVDYWFPNYTPPIEDVPSR